MPCRMCPLEGDTYQALIEAIDDPLYRAAAEYLNKKELGLDRWMREPPFWVQQAIVFVAAERQRIRERARKWEKDKARDRRQ